MVGLRPPRISILRTLSYWFYPPQPPFERGANWAFFYNAENWKWVLAIAFLLMMAKGEGVKASAWSVNQNTRIVPILVAQQKLNTEDLEEQLIEGMDKGIKGDYEGAIAVFSRLIAQYPHYAEAYYNRGVAQGKLGNDKAAIADYNQAIKINPKLAEAYQERGLLWQKQGNNKKAIADLKKAAFLYKSQGNLSADQSVQEVLENISNQ